MSRLKIEGWVRPQEIAKFQEYARAMRKDPTISDASRLLDFGDIADTSLTPVSPLVAEFEDYKRLKNGFLNWLQRARIEACHALFTAEGMLRPELMVALKLSATDIDVMRLGRLPKQSNSEGETDDYHYRLIDAYVLSLVAGPACTDIRFSCANKICSVTHLTMDLDPELRISHDDPRGSLADIQSHDTINGNFLDPAQLSDDEIDALSYLDASKQIEVHKKSGEELRTLNGFRELLNQTVENTKQRAVDHLQYACDLLEQLDDTANSKFKLMVALEELGQLVMDTIKGDVSADTLTAAWEDTFNASGRLLSLRSDQLRYLIEMTHGMKQFANASQQRCPEGWPSHFQEYYNSSYQLNQGFKATNKNAALQDLSDCVSNHKATCYQQLLNNLVNCIKMSDQIDPQICLEDVMKITDGVEKENILNESTWQATRSFLDWHIRPHRVTRERVTHDGPQSLWNRIRGWVSRTRSNIDVSQPDDVYIRQWQRSPTKNRLYAIVAWCVDRFSNDTLSQLKREIRRLPSLNMASSDSITRRIGANRALLAHIGQVLSEKDASHRVVFLQLQRALQHQTNHLYQADNAWRSEQCFVMSQANSSVDQDHIELNDSSLSRQKEASEDYHKVVQSTSATKTTPVLQTEKPVQSKADQQSLDGPAKSRPRKAKSQIQTQVMRKSSRRSSSWNMFVTMACIIAAGVATRFVPLPAQHFLHTHPHLFRLFAAGVSSGSVGAVGMYFSHFFAAHPARHYSPSTGRTTVAPSPAATQASFFGVDRSREEEGPATQDALAALDQEQPHITRQGPS